MSSPEQDAGAAPTEEELRAAYEAELSRISAVDMIFQAAVSLLNIGAHRIGPPPGSPEPAGSGRDLEQVQDAVDAAGALVKVLERRVGAKELAPLRDALSRLQMAYATEAGAAGGAAEPAPAAQQGAPAADAQPPADAAQPGDSQGPGPAESSGRLWVPGR